MLLQRHRHHRLEINLSNFYHNKIFIEGEAEETLPMQEEDERREDNTGEEETTFTTSTEVS